MSDIPQLMKFYKVETIEQLIAEMDLHIVKLQAKLPKDTMPVLSRVREG